MHLTHRSISRIHQTIPLLILIGISSYYFYCLPVFIQGGDTAELVASAYRLLVPHPPGYPLWIWIQNLWTHLISYQSVFWRASFLSMLFSVGTLGLVALALRKSPLISCLCLLTLGTSTSFSESAILPDVFSFHGLLTSMVGVLYLFGPQSSTRRSFLIPLLFFLGLAHHQTMVFLFPVLGSVLIFDRPPPSRNHRLLIMSAYVGFAFGFFLLIALYASLSLLHPKDPWSWGLITETKSVIKHFLRMDYGTFQLSPFAMPGTWGLEALGFLIEANTQALFGLIVFTGIVIPGGADRPVDSRAQTWRRSILLSLGFFLITNIHPTSVGTEVLSRFHVMPLIQIVLYCGYLLTRQPLSKGMNRLGFLIVLVTLALSSGRLVPLSVLRNNSTIEDYSKTLLQIASTHNPAAILTANDSAYFGTRYIQTVFGLHRDIAVVSPPLLFHPWYFEKTRKINPHFELLNQEQAWQTRAFKLEEDLIRPNLAVGLNLIVTEGFRDSSHYAITYFPLGRKISQGLGVSFDDSLQSQLRTSAPGGEAHRGPQGLSRAKISAEYAHFWLAKALEAHQSGQTKRALDFWEEALRRYPLCLPALTNLCILSNYRDERCRTDHLEQMKIKTKFIYDSD